MPAMLDVNLRRLTSAGWVLAVLSLGAIVAVAIPVGSWIYESQGPRFVRENKGWLLLALAIPGLLFGAAVFALGARVARNLGVRVLRED